MARVKDSAQGWAAKMSMKKRPLGPAPIPLMPERCPASPSPHDQVQVLMNMKQLPVELITEVGKIHDRVLLFILSDSRYAGTYTPRLYGRYPAPADNSIRS
jgi:hypothetical protein